MLPQSLIDRPARKRPQVALTRAVMRANAALREHHKTELQPFGLTLTEFDFLAALGGTKGLRMKDLAHAMISTPSNVTRVCAAMEKRGFSVRERSLESDREVIAKLTPKGEKLFEKTFPVIVEFTTRTMDELMSTDDQRRVVAALDKLVARINEAG